MGKSEQTAPYLIRFPKIGTPVLGYISVCEEQSLPFLIKRVYWTYFTPEDVIRGGHAHYELEQILVAASGKIIVNTELPRCTKQEFVLDHPNVGLFLPKRCWHEMHYSHNSVQMALASLEYSEKDYIRHYPDFLALQ